MKHTAGTLNRTCLAILGILILATGVLGLLQAAGILQAIAQTPEPEAKVVSGELHPFFAQTWVVALMLVIGVVFGVLALAWMIAQVPRRNLSEKYRLHLDTTQGRTTCEPSVLASAVVEQINGLPGVVTSSARLRGTADQPDLDLKVTVNDGADIRELLRKLEGSIPADVSTALESPIQRCRLELDVSARTQQSGAVVHSTGTVLQ